MRKSLLVLALVLLAGCTSETEFGKCVGVNGTKDPKLTYEIPTKNIVLGVVFVETVFVPVVILLKETHCPIGRVGQ